MLKIVCCLSKHLQAFF